MSFRVTGLSQSDFEPLFGLDDATLEARAIRRMTVDSKPGFPCRVSLEDVPPGEHVLLLNYLHQPANSPYRATGPIFVRETVCRTFDRVGELPPVFAGRLLSVRAYDADGMIVDADVVPGNDARILINRLLARRDTDYLHAHYAGRGCYACRIDRA